MSSPRIPFPTPEAMTPGAPASLPPVSARLDGQALISVNGKRLPPPSGSICVPGDGPGAVATARHLRDELVRRCLEFARKNKALREEVEEKLSRAMKSLVLARATSGGAEI